MFRTHFINFVETYFGVYHVGVGKLKESEREGGKSRIQVSTCIIAICC